MPTVAESGFPGFEVTSWYATCAPASVPAAILDQLNAGIAKTLSMPDIRERLLQIATDPSVEDPRRARPAHRHRDREVEDGGEGGDRLRGLIARRNLLHKVYPDARLIFIVRDGRDAAVSHRFQAFIDSPQHLNSHDLDMRRDFSRDPEPFLSGKRSIFTPNGIHNAARGWVNNVEETDSS